MSITSSLRTEIECAIIEAVESECYGEDYESICEGVANAVGVDIYHVETVYDDLYDECSEDFYDEFSEGYDE